MRATTLDPRAARPRLRPRARAVRAATHLGPLAAFGALAGFCAAQWAALVAAPPVWRVVAVVLLATAGGAAIGGVRPTGVWRARSARFALALLTLACALVATGATPAQLWPAGWGELGAGLDRGLAGVRTLDWPYAGPDPWVRLTLLLAIPATLVPAAVLAFWPARRRWPGMLGVGLVLLLYGVAVAQHATGEPLARGALLLILIAAWLFLPGLRPRAAVAAGTMTLVALGAALALAASVTGDEPLVDYRSWHWLGRATTYDWNHSYGPIDWPRRGETVLTVESRSPHYWRTAALDRFDGLRWVRSSAALGAGADPGLPADPPARWEAEAEVRVGALDTTLVAAPGAVRSVEGAGSVTLTRDGGARSAQELEQGSTYAVRAYAPDPDADRMRTAPDPAPYLQRPYTLIHLPPEGSTNLDPIAEGEPEDGGAVGRPIVLPRHGDGLGGTPNAVGYVRESPYARVYGLARRLAAGAPTTYDVVRRVEAHLRATYGYSEDPPERDYPLAAFLFADRVGYCQQFSGAMALLLRMNGVPTRVATGFAPGARSADGGSFTVRDLDAHSWVEVHFAGIGWVPFDPTPADAPARSRADGSGASAAGGGEAGLEGGLSDALGGEATPSAEPPPRGEAQPPGTAGGRDLEEYVAAALIALGLAAAAVTVRRRRPGPGQDAAVLELRRALERLGHPVGPGTTLMDIERRLATTGRTAAARYVRRLRERRFAGREAGVAPADRSALRAALTAGAGPLRRALGYAVLPPRRGWGFGRVPSDRRRAPGRVV